MKRLFDIILSVVGLVVTFPLLIFAYVGIKLTSPGATLYRAVRIGKDQKPFQMLKFRSMHIVENGAVITSKNDPRIFGFGKFLRKSKIDELPQLWNALKGDMSIVGPRPEDPKIVRESYTDWMLETLGIRPGVTGPGAIYFYGYGEKLVSDDAPEQSYVEDLLPPKLAIERAYLERATLLTDIIVMVQTLWAIVKVVRGKPVTLPHQDIAMAQHWVSQEQLRIDS